MRFLRIAQFVLALSMLDGVVHAENEASQFVVPESIEQILADTCLDCHSGDSGEAGVQLDNLAELSLDSRLALLNRVQQQLFFGLMPPKDANQLKEAADKELHDWMNTILRRHNASELDDKLRYPDYANFLDHDKLFDSGERTSAAFTPARRWLVSPQIFRERVMDVFELEGREREGIRNRGFFGVKSPFLLPDRSGVRYYDNSMLDGGDLLVMLANAEWISRKQLRPARVKKGEIGAKEFEDQKDRWSPRSTPAEFEAIVLKNELPTDDEIALAIHKQFGLVLRRAPTSEETVQYAALARKAIGLGGNTKGLQQVLTAVLLESEFLYRLEFGDGETDEHGRKLLAPQEAAFAISYAIGNRSPDDALLKAAAEGHLRTKQDYEREVKRMLADESYFKGYVDPTISGHHYRGVQTSHPRLVVFFRDFFGYPAAVKIFKDPERSGGYYENPRRDTLATPGALVNEADRIVTWHVERDEDVFEQLLTSDKYFVCKNKPDEEDQKILDDWWEAYEAMKGKPWLSEPERIFGENEEYLESKNVKCHPKRAVADFLRYMHMFEDTFGKGTNPVTKPPFTYAYFFKHSTSYGLPPLPSRKRYERINPKRPAQLEPQEFWDYQVEQPFSIPDRKGILSHPAWLVAHSSNFHNDPIKRGRWIREKLLAGRVPDVPITVDAQVPDDPHKTFRERVELVTKADACAKCHTHMNPLGLPFEMFDDFGRTRTEEALEHPENILEKNQGIHGNVYKTRPVDSTGELIGTKDSQLDGGVQDAIDLIDRLGKSTRVRQSIIRHAFRFYMGRNESMSDAQTLIDADRAYVHSGGSFKAVVVSLLTSDSFRYRKQIND